MSKRSSEAIEERLALLQQPHVGPACDIKPADPLEPTPMRLTIDKINPYDRNPRRERNEAYDLIKHSLRQRGFRGTLPITCRPGDPLYMVAEGGNTVLQILKELYVETQDTKFFEIPCLFEPWVSESETLIAHLGENDNRGQLLFIDRARAIRELRDLLEAEKSQALSSRDFVTYLRERGYLLDQASLVKMDYAVETLFSVIPDAFRAGLGVRDVERIRKLESTMVTFLEHRESQGPAIEGARRWFLDCLARHDNEDLATMLDSVVQRELDGYVASLCEVSVALVRADFGFIESTGKPGPEPSAPVAFDLPKPRLKSGRAPAKALTPVPGETERPMAPLFRERSDDDFDAAFDLQEEEFEPASPMAVRPVSRDADLPQDVKSLRGRMWTLARLLAQHHRLGECVVDAPSKGCGFLIDLPDNTLFKGHEPASAEEARRCTLWWMLLSLADEMPYSIERAPALAYLENARIYPVITAVAEGDQQTALTVAEPRVSLPPTLDHVSRELFGGLDEADYQRLLQLIEARRALEVHCRRLGKHTVWEL